MSSGAKIIELGDIVVKANGGDRIDEQAAWLERYKGKGIVKVVGSWHGGYAMERLEEVHRPVNPYDVIHLLQDYVWCHTPQEPLNWTHVIAYAANLARGYWPEALDPILNDAQWLMGHEDKIRAVRVHGDPTFENVMRRDNDLVLIDPIPGRYYAPDIMAVDLGKILQSCCGYEAMLAGDDVVGDPEVDWLLDFSRWDVALAKWFGLVHVCRFLPYLSEELQEKMRETVGANMLRLRPGWRSD